MGQMMSIFRELFRLTAECVKDCYIQTCIVSLTAGLMTVFVKAGRQKGKKSELVGEFFYAAFMACYLSLIAYGTFLLRTPGFRREVCLIPFHIFLNWNNEKVYIIGNFLMMMPLAVLLMIRTRKILTVAASSAVLCIAIEVSQYIFSVGKSELDDFILNVAGAALMAFFISLIRKKKG